MGFHLNESVTVLRERCFSDISEISSYSCNTLLKHFHWSAHRIIITFQIAKCSAATAAIVTICAAAHSVRHWFRWWTIGFIDIPLSGVYSQCLRSRELLAIGVSSMRVNKCDELCVWLPRNGTELSSLEPSSSSELLLDNLELEWLDKLL